MVDRHRRQRLPACVRLSGWKLVPLWLAVALLSMAAAATAGDDLAPFLGAHRAAQALAEQKKWAEAANAYGAFAAGQPQDACAPLAWALQGILLRRELNQPAQAREAFLRAAKAPATPFGQEIRTLALGWAARLQMEQLAAPLRRYWVDHVEYPEKLEALAESKLVPPEALVDPWGKPFVYSTLNLSDLAGRKPKKAADLPRQGYTLRCALIPGDSRQIGQFLKETVEFPKRFELKGIGGVRPLVALITFEDKVKKTANVAEGEKAGSARLVKLTPQGAVLIEGGAVAVLSR